MTFVLPDGRRRSFDVAEGLTLLDVARLHDIAIEGACGGSMACATCHVVVDEAFWDLLPEPAPEEEDMLDLAPELEATSRLGCQIRMTQALDGLVVRVPRTTLLE
ncbi:2Fe-2S iron-sulfur cluster-binding protein [Geminicoccaceae bacterium SYSU G07066]|uniref:2Fe-2S iron-sulfur cluster-binding protein n=1 Tax=Benzoatithermus flavus TaxID=3108223 RepID=A0ABU8XN11_9PROT